MTGYYSLSGMSYAFVYSDGVYTQLDIPGGAILITADGINDSGVVVGSYAGPSGGSNFIATPAAVPEPSSLVLALAGAGAVALLAADRARRGGRG